MGGPGSLYYVSDLFQRQGSTGPKHVPLFCLPPGKRWGCRPGLSAGATTRPLFGVQCCRLCVVKPGSTEHQSRLAITTCGFRATSGLEY